MRQPKQRLLVDGETLLGRTVGAVSSVPRFDRVWVVLGAHATNLAALVEASRAQIVINPRWSEGLATSVRAGLQAARESMPRLSSVVFCLADQPLLRADDLNLILDTAESGSPGLQLVAARYDGHPGAPCWADASLFDSIEKLSGDHGLRPLFTSLAPREMTTVDLPALAMDLDTPEDYRKLISGSP